MTTVRPPAVAGYFYPAESDVLSADVGRHLAAAATSAAPPPKAIIVPHAGYDYSAAVAAPAYAALRSAAARIKRVVLLGPGHRVGVAGLAAPTTGYFRTPFGDVPLDRATIDGIAGLPQVELRDDAHRDEHCLEVQLPFLQSVLSDFTLVPLVVGGATPEQVAEVLQRLWGGPETLVVISSDLSHYHDYDTAQRMDSNAAEAIESMNDSGLASDQACGRLPIAGLLRVAKQRGLSAERLDLRNSGDTGGPRDRVVGYGSWAFRERPAEQDGGHGTEDRLKPYAGRLLRTAAVTLRYALRFGKAPRVTLAKVPAPLRDHMATFVTLKHGKRLRGCVGTVEPSRPLAVDVVENAYGAAFRDPRFGPLKRDELSGLSVSISVLSRPSAIRYTDEKDLLQQLQAGRDGLILRGANARGVFLPQVWIDLATPDDFLARLKAKAGIDRSLRPKEDHAARFAAHSVGTVVLNAGRQDRAASNHK